jgi:hypothetical protein
MVRKFRSEGTPGGIFYSSTRSLNSMHPKALRKRGESFFTLLSAKPDRHKSCWPVASNQASDRGIKFFLPLENPKHPRRTGSRRGLPNR